MTRQEFIELAPLYNKVEIKNFTPPASITRICNRTSCRRETTWSKGEKLRCRHGDVRPEMVFESVAYCCGLCKNNSVVIVYELLNWCEDPSSPAAPKQWQHTAVRKIGQIPPQDVQIPSELEERLGQTAAHYKKALVCRAQNYGIGAMAYLRRVVDEKTDELIDVMAELSQTYNANDEEIAQIVKAKTEVRYEDKLRVASELIPDAVRPAGVNPLGQLYKSTSIGLHGKSDDECIAIFDGLREDFEYVFRNLHLQAEERRKFAQRVQARAGGLFPTS